MEEEYYSINCIEELTGNCIPFSERSDRPDETYELISECYDFVQSIKNSLERDNIPFDQIQLRARICLTIKKEAYNKLKKWINKDTTKEAIKQYIYGFLFNDIANYVELQIDGDLNETGTIEKSIKEFYDEIKKKNCTNLSKQEHSLMNLQEYETKYNITRLERDIHCGTVNLNKFIFYMKKWGFSIKFDDMLVDEEHVKEALIEKFFEKEESFYMNMAYDFGRKTNKEVKFPIKKK